MSGIVSNSLGKFMYIHAYLLHSVIIDIEDMTKRATALCIRYRDLKNEKLSR